MNNPNPFVPQGSLLEQQSKRRSRLKLAVFCVLTVSVTGLVGMLIQGCKRSAPTDEGNPPMMTDTNLSAETDTNLSSLEASNPPVLPPVLPPVIASNPPPVLPPPLETSVVPAAGSEYVVKSGDTLARIAKKNGVSLKALEAANPNVQPTRLKVGQKLVIPAGGKASADLSAGGGDIAGGDVYVVKSGDTLTKIARAHGTTVKAIEKANHLSTTKIRVGQKLNLPAKTEAAPVAPAVPAETMPAPPVAMPESAPAAPTAPAGN
jgi:LysM repeat protein